jgi:hypothetical protein
MTQKLEQEQARIEKLRSELMKWLLKGVGKTTASDECYEAFCAVRELETNLRHLLDKSKQTMKTIKA